MQKKLDGLTVYVAGKLEEYRSNNGLSQQQLADKVGLNRSSIVNIENHRQQITIKNIYKFSMALDIEVVELLPSKEWYSDNKDVIFKKVVTFERL